MSGVLDRMAQRALGLLPVVQPLVAPRYAESPRAFAVGPDMAAGLETTVETEAAAPVRARERDARKPSITESDGPVQPQEDKQEVRPEDGSEVRGPANRPGAPRLGAPKSATLKPAILNPAILNPATAQPGSLEKISQLRPPVQRSSQPAVEAGAEVTTELRSQPAETQVMIEDWNRGRTTQAPKPLAHLERMGPQRETAKPEGMREDRKTSAAMGALSTQDEPSRQQIVRPPQSPIGNRAVAAPSLVADRRAIPQGERQAAQEKTEVHISIGNIELRAPRVETRRAAPAQPFKPRVSLDDFLRRGQETRS
ncbi:MAG: hypothetical protein WBP85_05415 [Terracidiphilus sp.]